MLTVRLVRLKTNFVLGWPGREMPRDRTCTLFVYNMERDHLPYWKLADPKRNVGLSFCGKRAGLNSSVRCRKVVEQPETPQHTLNP